MSAISIKNLKVSYGKTLALNGLNLDIKVNEFVGIIGPNGGGKTTLIKSVLGLIKPDSGQIYIDYAETIGYVPQFKTFDRKFPISVRDVILTGHLPRRITIGHRFSKHEIAHAYDCMERLNIVDLAKRQIGQLSDGQLQRVLIARALMAHPTILILDEAMVGVDEESKKEILAMLKRLKGKMTIIMITHMPDLVKDLVTRFIKVDKQAKEIELERVTL